MFVGTNKSLRRNLSAQAVLLQSVVENLEAPGVDPVTTTTMPPRGARFGYSARLLKQDEERKAARRHVGDEALTSRRQFLKELRQKIDEAKRRHRARSISAGTSSKPTWRSLLVQLTQPAHLVVLLAALALAYVLKPTSQRHAEFTNFDWFCGVCHVVAFATQFGSQMWMTFVSGLALFFQIPRHTFGAVQRVLFPLYFLLNSVWAFIVLASYKRLHDQKIVEIEYFASESGPPPSTPSTLTTLAVVGRFGLIDCDGFLRQINTQVVILTLAFVIQLAVRLFLAPALVKLAEAKTEMEKAAGVGMEVGKYELGDLRKCPRFMRMHKAFRRVHAGIAVCNMVAMFFNSMHLLHLANIVVDNFN